MKSPIAARNIPRPAAFRNRNAVSLLAQFND